ncbi:unnamed protein product [Clonostachys rosea f. rosea IK726]|jgi:hypothetical protein|uniref:Uncharacterized protein n=1 Tax=Clonostachys rosea f. rosea IK726 TaxID=1349383 RepID=A0ACA9TAZ4_BIOOC|nr:unnamed protein product [Clonostachys rosea f. rosea IK726]
MNGHIHPDRNPGMGGMQESNNSSLGDDNAQPQSMHANNTNTVSPQQLGINSQSTSHQPVGNDWVNMTMQSVPSVTGTMSSDSAHDGGNTPRPCVLPGAGQHPLTAAMLERFNQLNSEDNVNMRIAIKHSLRAKKDKASATRVSNDDTVDLGPVSSQPTPFDSEVFAAGAWSDTPPEVHDFGLDDGVEDLFLAK